MGLAEFRVSDNERPTGGGAEQGAKLLDEMLAAAEELDPGTVRVVLDRAKATFGLAECIDRVVLPAMRQLGEWWATGRCAAVQERMATEAVRAWLDWHGAFAPRPQAIRPILLTCGPRDQHTIGLESLTLLLRVQGWPCRNLGARVPTDDVVIAARATDPAAIVVVSHLSASRRFAVASLDALDQLGLPVFFAGNAFATTISRAEVPGVYLGTDLELASRQLVDALTLRAARSE